MKNRFKISRWLLLLLLATYGTSAWADTEPNNTLPQATALNLNTQVSGTMSQTDTEDWYIIPLPAEGTVNLAANYANDMQGFIYFHYPNGAQINFSVGGTGAKELSAGCIGSDEIAVRLTRTAGEGSYSLTVTLNSAGASEPEPNGFISFPGFAGVPQSFGSGESFEGTLGHNTGAAIDSDDWFRYDNPTNGTVTLDFESEDDVSGFLYFYEADGAQLGFVPFNNGEPATLSINCRVAGPLYGRISRTAGCGRYTAEFNTLPYAHPSDVEPNGGTSLPSTSAIPQTFEENELFTGNLNLVDTNGVVDANDWFNYVSPRDGNVTFEVNLNPGATAFIYLYQTDGTQLGFSLVGSGLNSFTAFCQGQDTLLGRVSASAGCGSYTARFYTSTLDHANDIEPNGTSSFPATNVIQETFLENQEFSGHIGYDLAENGLDTQDWFYYISPRDGDVTFEVDFDSSVAAFIYLYHKDGTQLGFAPSGTGLRSFTANCQAADTLVGRINQTSGCGSYTARFFTSTLDHPGDIEPNGTASAVSSIASIQETFLENQEFSGHLGYDDAESGVDSQDWFYYISSANGDVTFEVDLDSSAVAFIYLYQKDGTQLGFAPSGTGLMTFTASCQAADTLVGRIGLVSGCGAYTARFFTTEPTFNNDVEPNNSLAEATSIEFEDVVQGQIGYDDAENGTDANDYYAFNVADVPFDIEIDLAITGSHTGFLYLYGPTGSQLTFQSYSAGDATFNFTVNQPGTYTFRVNRVAGCGSYALSGFCGETPETSIVADNLAFCPGESMLLEADGAFNAYRWLLDGEVVGNQSTYLASEAGTYQLAVFDGNLCPGFSQEVDLTNYPMPALTINASGETTFCPDGSVQLTASAGFESYVWSSGESSASITATTTGDYSVSATTADGCESSAGPITVTVLDSSDPACLDCPALEANIGDSCDDGNPNTENDTVNADCQCVGSEVFDCPVLEANIGDSCDDGNPDTENDVVTADCGCEGELVQPCSFTSVYLADYGGLNSGTNIYSVNLTGSVAELSWLENLPAVGGLAYNAAAQELWLVRKNGNGAIVYNPVQDEVVGNQPFANELVQIGGAGFDPVSQQLLVVEKANATAGIYAVDPTTGAATLVQSGNLREGDIEVIGDVIYALKGSFFGKLFKIENNAVALIGNAGLRPTGLCALGNGNLLVSFRGSSQLVETTTDGEIVEVYDILVDGSTLTLNRGDLASGCSNVSVAASVTETELAVAPGVHELMDGPENLPVTGGISTTALPNPTDNRVLLGFTVATGCMIHAELIALDGRVMAVVYDGSAEPEASYIAEINTESFQNGVYLYRVQSESGVAITKVIVRH